MPRTTRRAHHPSILRARASSQARSNRPWRTFDGVPGSGRPSLPGGTDPSGDSEILGFADGTVKTYLHRAGKSLRRFFRRGMGARLNV